MSWKLKADANFVNCKEVMPTSIRAVMPEKTRLVFC